MTVMQKDIPEVIVDVNERLASKGKPLGLDLMVEPRDYRIEDDWLYLCVTTSQEGIRPFDFAEVLGDVERELRRDGVDKVLLVPTLAD